MDQTLIERLDAAINTMLNDTKQLPRLIVTDINTLVDIAKAQTPTTRFIDETVIPLIYDGATGIYHWDPTGKFDIATYKLIPIMHYYSQYFSRSGLAAPDVLFFTPHD